MRTTGTPSGWQGMADAYAASFAALCEGTVGAVLAAAGLGTACPPRRLLDVGTGSGAVAARACALGAEVVAVDPEPDMRALAAKAAPRADVRAGSLPRLPFPDGGFDAVVANFVLNHVPDPWAAVRELHRVTAVGGRAVVTFWPADRGPLDEAWSAAAAAVGATWPPAPQLPPERDVERTAGGLRALLDAAGLGHPEVTEVRWTARVDAGSLWAGAVTGIARIGRLVAGRTEPEQAAMRRAYDGWAAPRRDGDGLLPLALTAVLGSGVR